MTGEREREREREREEFSKVLIHNLMIHNLKSYNCVRVKSIDIRVKSISNCVEF
jgi:hypothetical protein